MIGYQAICFFHHWLFQFCCFPFKSIEVHLDTQLASWWIRLVSLRLYLCFVRRVQCSCHSRNKWAPHLQPRPFRVSSDCSMCSTKSFYSHRMELKYLPSLGEIWEFFASQFPSPLALCCFPWCVRRLVSSQGLKESSLKVSELSLCMAPSSWIIHLQTPAAVASSASLSLSSHHQDSCGPPWGSQSDWRILSVCLFNLTDYLPAWSFTQHTKQLFSIFNRF